jgi:arylsulfatase A-like enzyme
MRHLLKLLPSFILFLSLSACNDNPNGPAKTPGFSETQGPPNIVLILADDLDFDEAGFYDAHPDTDLHNLPSYTAAQKEGLESTNFAGTSLAYTHIKRWKSPNLNHLSQQGAIFERFYVTSPVCNPSRFSLLTGKYASRSQSLRKITAKIPELNNNQMIGFTADLNNEKTVAHDMSDLGYRTSMVGKWHNFLPPHPGWLRGVREADPKDPQVAKYMAEKYQASIDKLLETSGFESIASLYAGNIQEYGLPKSIWKTETSTHGHNLEWLAEGSRRFIESDDERPFFLYVPLTSPHGWLGPIGATKDAKLTPSGVLTGLPESGMPSRENVRKRSSRNTSAEMLLWTDDFVGSLMQKLEETGKTDNTIFIFTSDHGNRGKETVYEGARVPTFIYWPEKIKPLTVVSGISANIDIAPTLVAIGGGSPADLAQYDGISLLPELLDGESDLENRKLLLEIGASKAIVTTEWKYIANRAPKKIRDIMKSEESLPLQDRKYGWAANWVSRWKTELVDSNLINYESHRFFPSYFDEDQLYNLRNDPLEQVQLFDQEENMNIARSLQKELDNAMTRTNQVFGEFGHLPETALETPP